MRTSMRGGGGGRSGSHLHLTLHVPPFCQPSGSIVGTGPLSVILEEASSDHLELFRALTAMQGGEGLARGLAGSSDPFAPPVKDPLSTINACGPRYVMYILQLAGGRWVSTGSEKGGSSIEKMERWLLTLHHIKLSLSSPSFVSAQEGAVALAGRLSAVRSLSSRSPEVFVGMVPSIGTVTIVFGQDWRCIAPGSTGRPSNPCMNRFSQVSSFFVGRRTAPSTEPMGWSRGGLISFSSLSSFSLRRGRLRTF